MIIAYCDGACSNNQVPELRQAAAACIIVKDDQILTKRVEKLGNVTNQAAELWSVKLALEATSITGDLTIITDSQYAIGIFSQGWKPKANFHLIEEIKSMMNGRIITFRHVKGHNGEKFQEMTDALAVAATR